MSPRHHHETKGIVRDILAEYGIMGVAPTLTSKMHLKLDFINPLGRHVVLVFAPSGERRSRANIRSMLRRELTR